MNNRKIIILCGGRGKRLGKITKEIPKPLVKIGNKSILDHKLEFYNRKSFKDFIFCVGYKSDMIINHLDNLGIKGIISDEGENTGMLKRIYSVKDDFSDQVIISYGDTFAEIDLQDLLDKHINSKAKLTLVSASIENPFGLLNWNNDNKVTSFIEKPILNHYIGYSVMDKNIFEYIPENMVELSNGNGFIKAVHHLTKLGLVNAYKFSGLQLTVNTNEDLEYANNEIGKYYTFRESNEK